MRAKNSPVTIHAVRKLRGDRIASQRHRQPTETRRALIETAARIFNSAGYHGTDSNRIAREAGYAPGTFYVHFADKREIFLEVYRGWVSSEWQAIAAAIAPEKGAAVGSQSLRIAQAVLRHHREWRM